MVSTRIGEVTGRLRFYIDFDNDGVFGASDEVTADVWDARWKLGMHEPQQLVGDETRLEMTLNNTDKRYSIERLDSPYYGRLLPQRRVQVTGAVGGSEVVLYTGYIDVIAPAPLDGVSCRITATGAKQYMQAQMVHLPLLQDVRADEILEAIMLQLHLPPALNEAWLLGIDGNSELGISTTLSDLSTVLVFDQGNSVFPYVADNWDADFQGNQYVNKDWQTGFKGYTAIADVVEAEMGRFFFGRAGEAIFWARDRLQLKTAVDEVYSQDYFKEASYVYGKRIYNDVKVMVYPRRISATDEIVYQLDEPLRVRAGSERRLRAKYVSPENAEVSVIAPSVFELTTDGLGAQYTVEFDARTAKFEFTTANEDDSSEYEVRTLILKGQTLTDYNEIEEQVADALSITLYGRRELVIDSKLMANENLARSIAEYRLAMYRNPRGELIWVEFLVDNDGKFADALGRLIGDRITVSDARLGHEADYFVIGEEHRMTARVGYRVRWYLERADQTASWILGTVGFSELGVTTTLGV